jgi:hypothetical protein
VQFEFGSITVHLPPLIVSAGIIAIIYLLSRWSQELKERRYTIFLYFFVSAMITPLFSAITGTGGIFQLWFPLGFAATMLYLAVNRYRRHPAKYKACLLGLAAAVYQLLQQYQILPM